MLHASTAFLPLLQAEIGLLPEVMMNRKNSLYEEVGIKSILRPEGPRSWISYIVMFFFVVLLFPADALTAEPRKIQGPVDIEADTLDYVKDTDTYHARGNVIIRFSEGVLTADSVALNKSTNEALAEGHVSLKSGGDILEGDILTFNIETKSGAAENARIFMVRNHVYLKGSRIEKEGEARYRVFDATATTCDGAIPDWSFSGKELDVTIDGYGTVKHGKFNIRNFPVFYTPYLIFPAKTTRQSGFLLPTLAYSRDKHGVDIELPFFWAISPNLDATFYSRYMEERGFMEGLEIRYFISPDSYGTFYADYLNDNKNVTETLGAISRDWQSDRQRGSFYLNHETTFSSGFYLRSDIYKVSDSWYFKDFSSKNYYRDHYSTDPTQRFKRISFQADESLNSLDSTVRLVKDAELYNITALARYTDDFTSPSNDQTLQKYPEISLFTVKRPLLGTPLHGMINGTYDYFYRNEGQKGHMYDIQPLVSLPVRLGHYARFVPEFSVRETIWDRDDDESGTMPGVSHRGDRQVYTASAVLNTEFHRIYAIGGKQFDKIRHVIKPELTYTYIPDPSQEDIPDYVTPIDETNSLTYALTNTLTAKMREKDGSSSYREIVRFKLFQTYDIREARRSVQADEPDSEPFRDLNMELFIDPFSYLSFAARNKLDVNSGDWLQTNYDLVLRDWRGDSATLQYRYTQDSIEEINLNLNAKLTSQLDALFILRRNELEEKNLERTYLLKYHRQCWGVDFGYSDGDNDRRFVVSFSLYGMGI